VLYALLKPIVGIALRWYYREITISGLERVPTDGPTFLAVNHPNALVDALVVGWCMPRRVRFTAKATIFANPVAARFYAAVGVVPLRRASDEAAAAGRDPAERSATDLSRNAASFEAVVRALGDGGAVVIFPEGKSHDDPQLAPLKTGLARMAAQATDAGVGGLRIVPIGLLFERKETPRTRVLVRIGEPIALDTLSSAQRDVTALTQLVAERLAAVTLNFASHEDAERLQLVGGTLAPLLEAPSDAGGLLSPFNSMPVGTTPLSATLAMVRRLDRGLTAVRERDDPVLLARTQAFEARVRTFRTRLDALGLDVHDLALQTHTRAAVSRAAREMVLASVMVPLGFFGRVTHFVPLQLARRLAQRNVQSRDEPAMNTMVFGVVLVLVAYLVETGAVSALFGPWWGALFFLTLIPSASSDLWYGDRTRRNRARIRAFRRFRAAPALQRDLLAEADAIRREAGALELQLLA
jgi:glycerol-3-phosphate O-acyltransferase / dihydroxyacetone phosphate acyltransferase